jgi:hypothetical protein
MKTSGRNDRSVLAAGVLRRHEPIAGAVFLARQNEDRRAVRKVRSTARRVSFWASGRWPVAPLWSRLEAPMTEPQPNETSNTETEVVDEAADRRLANIVLGVGLLLLIGVGWWLANALFEARQADNCLSSGRRNCTPMETPRGQ